MDIQKLLPQTKAEKNIIKVNSLSSVCTYEKAAENDYNEYINALTADGAELRETYNTPARRFSALLTEDGLGIFVNYYFLTSELSIVFEDNTNYFNYKDNAREKCTDVELTQISLEDFGLSHVIRLSDGRFIILDGGREFEIESDKLYDLLVRTSPHEKPIIAVWILSHPHADHINCFSVFFDKYSDAVTLEKVMYTMPDIDDLDRFPKLTETDTRVSWNNSPEVFLPRVYAHVEKLGAEVFSPRAGQRYTIGDARCEFLASMDDALAHSFKMNALSLVYRMEICGQVILFMTDSTFVPAKLSERYGNYLKADILQVPHHGYGNQEDDAEIQGYKLIRPSVCLLSASYYDTYDSFSIYRRGPEYMLRYMGADEIILGEPERTIKLPYTATLGMRDKNINDFLAGRDSCGAKTWIFTELSTANPEDFEFFILNTTNLATTVWIDLFFENKSEHIRNIKLSAPRFNYSKYNIVGDEVDPDAKYCKWFSLKEKGIPENKPFAVRFRSEFPIVVSHKKHKATYSSINR